VTREELAPYISNTAIKLPFSRERQAEQGQMRVQDHRQHPKVLHNIEMLYHVFD